LLCFDRCLCRRLVTLDEKLFLRWGFLLDLHSFCRFIKSLDWDLLDFHHFWQLFGWEAELFISVSLQDNSLGIVLVRVASSWLQTALPCRLVIEQHLHLKHAFCAVKYAFVVVPQLKATD
jgi:hypothetical protein